jgi:chromosome segregation ATPase
MSAQNSQFKQEFQTSIDTLNSLNQRIQDSLVQKQQFSTTLLDKLRDINGQIQALAGLIEQLKATVDELQGQAGTNSTSIADKDRQIGELTQQKQALEAEKQTLQQQLSQLQQQFTSEKTALQQQIDADEGQIRDLTARNTAIQQQADALTAELAARGDLQGQHAQEIAAQTQHAQEQLAAQAQQAQEQMAAQAAANQQQIEQINAGIAAKDSQIADLQQQLQARTAEIETHVQNISSTQGQTQTQIDDLTRQIQELTTENDDLIQRIRAGTVAIHRATQNLEALINAVPNARTQQDVDQLFSQIGQSIQSISNSLTGRSSGGVPPPPAASSPSLPPINQIISQLNSKKQQNTPKKSNYTRAFNEISADSQNAAAILQREGIQFNSSGNIIGGRKTKKYKKQKGGFTYRANTKRKSISTISLTRGRGLRKGKRSSKTSKHFKN